MHQRGPISSIPSWGGCPIKYKRPHLHVPNILCGLRKQAPQSTKSPIRSLLRFLVPRITLRTSNTTLFTTPDNYNKHISNPGIRTNHTIALYDNIILRPLSPSARDKLTNVPRHRRSRHQSWRELHNDARLLDNPNPPIVDHNYKSHIPDTVNHNDIYITCADRYTIDMYEIRTKMSYLTS